MKGTTRLAHTTDHVKAGFSQIADIVEKVHDLSDGLADRCRDTYRDAERGVRKLGIGTEEVLDDTRKRIKSYPLRAMTLVASGSFVVGTIAGLSIARHRH